jgi:hypothetical protein
MRYQLVLQFRDRSLDDLDAIVALEDSLIEQLAADAEVDGHDIGSGETNIFIFTSDPSGTFSAIQPVLDHAGLLHEATVAYRPVDGNAYTIVWPAHIREVFRVA